MKKIVIQKEHFYEGLSKDSYNVNKLMVNIWDNTNTLNTLKKHSQFQKMWNFKTLKIQSMYVWKFKNSKLQKCFITYK
jgi:hypothetical protein